MGEINRYFSREFKINAVQLVTEKKMAVPPTYSKVAT
jgi:transposase-like protein